MLKETTLEAKCPRTRTIQRGVVLPVTLPFTLVDKGCLLYTSPSPRD